MLAVLAKNTPFFFENKEVFCKFKVKFNPKNFFFLDPLPSPTARFFFEKNLLVSILKIRPKGAEPGGRGAFPGLASNDKILLLIPPLLLLLLLCCSTTLMLMALLLYYLDVDACSRYTNALCGD